MTVKNEVSTFYKKDILTYTVYKSNKLVNSISDFTAIEHRILLCAIAQIKKTDTALTIYTVNASDITVDTHYNHIRKVVKKLQNTSIGISEDGVWTDYPFVECITFVKELGHCVINVIFSKKVEAFLIGIQLSYTKYTLANVIKFTCNYSLRIYEICKQNKNPNKKMSKKDVTIAYLRIILNLTHKYLKYNHFKNRVLLPAMVEINKYSDLHVSFEESVDNQKIYAITFDIQSNIDYMMDKNGEYYAEMS